MGIKVLLLEIQVGIIILMILSARPGMRKLPRVYSYVLWLLMFARLLVPVSFESRFGLMPSNIRSEAWLEENFGWTGMMTIEEGAGGDTETDAKAGVIAGDNMEMEAETGVIAGGDAGKEAEAGVIAGSDAEKEAEAGGIAGSDADMEAETGGIAGSDAEKEAEAGGIAGGDTEMEAETGDIMGGDTGMESGIDDTMGRYAGIDDETDGISGSKNLSVINHREDPVTGSITEADSYIRGDKRISNDKIGGAEGQEDSLDAGCVTGAMAATDSGGNRQLSAMWKMVLLLLWAAGAAAILAYNGTALILVKKQINGAECLGNNIYVCSQVKSPFTLGMIRPKIYLPPNLPEAEMEYIICHESVHIRRKDYLVKNIAFLLTALHWFNPLVWVAFYYMGRDMEMSCDEKVISKMGEKIKKQYSQSLLNFARGECPAAVTPITFGENSVKQRVSNVLAYRTASRWAAALGTVIIFASAAVMFTVRSDASEGNQDGKRQSSHQWKEERQSQDQQNADMQDIRFVTDLNTRVSVEDSCLAIKNIGAPAELIRMSLILAQSSPDSVLEYWARAFSDRNGNALFHLAADEENFRQWEMVEQRGDSFAFGESSPWAWAYDYEISMSSDDSEAEITFHMRTSVPEIYLLKEKVEITELGGLYYVDHESAGSNYSIDTAQEYMEFYGEDAVCDTHSIFKGYDVSGANVISVEENISDQDGVYGGNSVYDEMAGLYDDSFYRAILTHLQNGNNTTFYLRFLSPVSAAEELLHLGEGSGEVTGWHMMPERALRSEDAIHSGWESVEPPDWISTRSVAGEGSRVVVSYTFAEDGSCVEIPMELKEGSQGIWGLAGGSVRKVYSWVSEPEMVEHEEGKEDLTYVIELSNYGIYRLGAYSGLTCLWTGDVGPEAAARIYEDNLYILESLERAGENSDDGTEVVFVLDLFTGELYREYLAIPQNYENIFPNVSFGIRDGYFHIYGYGRTYRIPLENQNEILWNNKTFRQMSEEDKQAYGAENREYLLNNPGTLVRWSVREAGQTSVFIDLDGDGVSEQVILSADPSDKGQYGYHDAYQLRAGESAITGWGCNLHNDIWAYSPDGEKIILALYENGASDDPLTRLFGYENGELTALGEFRDDIRDCTMENGVISGTEFT